MNEEVNRLSFIRRCEKNDSPKTSEIKNRYFDIIDPEYRKVLDRANNKDENVFISNSHLGHAVYATKLILGKSNDENQVKMFSGQLKDYFYDSEEMREAFRNATKEGAKIRIVTEKIGNKNFLEFARKEKIEIRELKESKEKLGLKKLGHFVLVGSAFRFETPHPLEEIIAEGVVNFNNPESANLLSKVFDNLITKSRKKN